VVAEYQSLAIGIDAMMKLDVAAVEFDQVVLDNAVLPMVHTDAHARIIVDPAVPHDAVVAVDRDAVLERSQHLEAIYHHPGTVEFIVDAGYRRADDNGLPLHFRLDDRRMFLRSRILPGDLDGTGVLAGPDDDGMAAADFRERNLH